MPAAISLVGKVFGRLTVIALTDVRFGGRRCWLCACSCGNEKIVRGGDLLSGDTKSCSCLHAERGRTLGLSNYGHGETKNRKPSVEYSTWVEMHRRCRSGSRNSKYWAARGITVCDRWAVFENFLADMGRRPPGDYSIDRIDNDGHYTPDNCRWATKADQSRNRRHVKRESANV